MTNSTWRRLAQLNSFYVEVARFDSHYYAIFCIASLCSNMHVEHMDIEYLEKLIDELDVGLELKQSDLDAYTILPEEVS